MTQSWRQRMLEEKEQLDARIRKLDAFFKGSEFRELPSLQQNLLTQQFLAMQQYAAILTLRIES